MNLYGSSEGQLDRADLAAYVRALEDVLDDLEPERAAWHARDVVLKRRGAGRRRASPRLLRAVRHGSPRPGATAQPDSHLATGGSHPRRCSDREGCAEGGDGEGRPLEGSTCLPKGR